MLSTFQSGHKRKTYANLPVFILPSLAILTANDQHTTVPSILMEVTFVNNIQN